MRENEFNIYEVKIEHVSFYTREILIPKIFDDSEFLRESIAEYFSENYDLDHYSFTYELFKKPKVEILRDYVGDYPDELLIPKCSPLEFELKDVCDSIDFKLDIIKN
jgi:hypothetical protein